MAAPKVETSKAVVSDESKPDPNGPYTDSHDTIVPGGVYHLAKPGRNGGTITVNARGKRVNPDGTAYDPNAVDDGEDEETQTGGTVQL